MPKPNLIIVRESDYTFVQFEIDEDMKLLGVHCFTPEDPDDSYFTLAMSGVVIAERTAGGSIDKGWYTVYGPDETEETGSTVSVMAMDDEWIIMTLKTILHNFIEEHS